MARVSFEGLKRAGIALGWAFVFIAIGVGVTIGISALVPGWGGETWSIARTGSYEVIGFGLATLVVGRLLNKYSWDHMGWHRTAWRQLGSGVLMGAAMAALAIGLTVVLDRARVRWTGDWSVWPRVALPLIVGLLVAAVGEELGFRGYPLRRLSDTLGVIPAIVLLAILFGVAHAWNPSATVFSTVNVALAAIWLSLAFFSSGGMWLAWGAHFGWNASLAIVFDAPVSGYAFQVPGVEYTPGSHAWVDGGAFGPEGGIVATVALTVGIVCLLTRKSAFAVPEAAAQAAVAA